MGFIISRTARKKYNFDEKFFKPTGNVSFKDFKEVQRFAARLADLEARPGEINAMSLIHEIFQQVFHLYIKQKNPRLLTNIIKRLNKVMDKDELKSTLKLFGKEFPSQPVFDEECSIEEYLTGSTDGSPNKYKLVEELLLLWLTNKNPATGTYRKGLFNDAKLKRHSTFQSIIAELERFFSIQPFFGPKNQNLVAMLRTPAIAIPHSLSGQLEYIRDNWGELLGDFLSRLLSGLDLLKEEEKFGGMGPGEIPVYDFSRGVFEEEYERFSQDYDWMPRLILMAKSTYVWLDQLSGKYKRSISRLDQIPDEELEILSRRGFSGLWLIGLWERSQASKRIKQICGNPEALASAYSIYDYRVADDLGGQDALNNLKSRAWRFGIRLASDMVPNHMGIDSPWLVEHPEWFISLDYCPYPSYSFNGVDLSSDPRVSIYLEDHYYDRTDAAVVFKWVDNQSGRVRYVYHGNDGTSMPWNDTAQLNYLDPDVREAVTGTIFSVADMFPIIRFDAAMTLSKRHYQRLWYPEPGSGGDIPTRSWYGMESQEFHRRMPTEFWRQVVDRFAEKQSDTLLLAEAFWMMEPYFVRTLGMHRVYNSAFMNFLKNEENDKFRASIKNILQFNPEILKRFVNFMNNPDEETAIAQFGKDDKYFGVCTLMVTLPGLPMFGHGQIEGFSEKYGMEYRRAYWDERPDDRLIQRHERDIFPLLRKRSLFAHVEGFLFYDFYTTDGRVNEDVFAFSNNFSMGRSLVVYHNKFAETSGWIKTSVPFLQKSQGGDSLIRKDLAEGLALTPKEDFYVIFRDYDNGLEYIRNSKELFDKGLFVELKAFKKNVFLDFREIKDVEEKYCSRLADMLQGKGVPSIDKSLRKHFYNPLLPPWKKLMDRELFQRLTSFPVVGDGEGKEDNSASLWLEVEERLESFLAGVQELNEEETESPLSIARHISRMLKRNLSFILKNKKTKKGKIYEAITQVIGPEDFAWLFIAPVGRFLVENNFQHIWQLLDEWLLMEDLTNLFSGSGSSQENISQSLGLVRIMIKWHGWWQERDCKWLESFFADDDVSRILRVNRHDNVLWFHKESGELLLARLFMSSVLEMSVPEDDKENKTIAPLSASFDRAEIMKKALYQSGYRLETFKQILTETCTENVRQRIAP